VSKLAIQAYPEWLDIMLRSKIAPLILISSLLSGQVACWRNRSASDTGQEAPPATVNTLEQALTQARSDLESGKEFFNDDEDLKALESFERAIKLDPNLAEAHFRLAMTYDALGRQPEAVKSYKKAVESYKKHLENHPKDAEARYNLGQVYFGLNLYSDAVREYRQASQLRPDDSEVYYDLGLALSKLAQYTEAAAAFSKSLELDPENFRAQDELEQAQEGAKRIRAGRKHQEEQLRKQKERELKKQEEEASSSPAPPPRTQH
jgi:tetratricopeptide (TPR) repeat protein